jgi:hypothetical protein
VRGLQVSFIATALGLALLATSPARADAGGCKRLKRITSSDLARLRTQATEVAAGRKLDWSTSRPCGSARHALAVIRTRPERQPDGTELHGFAWCERDKVEWECKWGQFSMIDVTIVSVGTRRSVQLLIEGNLEASLAIPMFRHAVDLASALQLAQACGPGNGWQLSVDLKQVLDLVRKDLEFSETDGFATVKTSFNGGYAVEVNDSYLMYRKSSSGSIPAEFECWGNAPPIM